MADKYIIEMEIDDGKVVKQTKAIKKKMEAGGRDIGKRFAKGFNIAVGVAMAGVAVTMRKAISAAVVQENAINRLNQSMIAAGRYSREASQSMQDFAAEMQKTTTIGDEVAIDMLAFAGTFARTNEEAQRMVKVAADLQAAMGIELESGIRNLGKTFSGLQGELGEALPALRNLTAEQLKAGGAIDLLEQKFSGFAASQVRTFSGAMEQAGNNFGDLLENIGKFITRNPVAITAIATMSNQFRVLSKRIEDNADVIRAFANDVIQIFMDIAIGIAFTVENAVAALGKLHEAFVLISTPIRAVSAALKGLFGDKSFAEEMQGFSNYTKETLQNFTDLSSFGIGSVSEMLAQMKQEMLFAADAGKESMDDLATGTTGAVDKIANKLQSLNQTLRSVLVSGISSTIQGMVNAIFAGKNALEALGKGLLNIAGDMAISIGQFTVATGVAKLALEKLPGGQTIAAGLGLIALGSVLKAFGGGQPGIEGGGGTAGGTINNPVPVQPVETLPAEEQVVTGRAGTSVTLNVQGNILDRRETGLELADVLRETFQTNDIQFA